MMNHKKVFLGAVLPLFLISLSPVMAIPCASWKEADSSLRRVWPKRYPGEKIQKIEAAGEATEYDKMEATGQTMTDEKGNTWEFYKNAVFCRIPAKVTVTRESGSQVIFDVSAIFRQSGSGFAFFTVGVGESTEVATSGQGAPSKDEIKKLISAQWIKEHPDNQVKRVAISDPELKKDSSEGRWWYNVGADIYIVDENGEEKKCVNDYTTVFKGEVGKEGVDSSGPYHVNFLETPTCQ